MLLWNSLSASLGKTCDSHLTHRVQQGWWVTSGIASRRTWTSLLGAEFCQQPCELRSRSFPNWASDESPTLCAPCLWPHEKPWKEDTAGVFLYSVTHRNCELVTVCCMFKLLHVWTCDDMSISNQYSKWPGYGRCSEPFARVKVYLRWGIWVMGSKWWYSWGCTWLHSSKWVRAPDRRSSIENPHHSSLY